MNALTKISIAAVIVLLVFWFPVFQVYKTLATPTITPKFVTEQGTMYAHKSGRMVFIPSSDTGLFADDQAKAKWLATCVNDVSKFSLNGYLQIALERKVK